MKFAIKRKTCITFRHYDFQENVFFHAWASLASWLKPLSKKKNVGLALTKPTAFAFDAKAEAKATHACSSAQCLALITLIFV